MTKPKKTKASARCVVGIIMGSQSDWSTMKAAADMLDALGVPYESKIVSAHRTPQRLYEYATGAQKRGLKIIIAGAGGAAHLPGMTASLTAYVLCFEPRAERPKSGTQRTPWAALIGDDMKVSDVLKRRAAWKLAKAAAQATAAVGHTRC